MTITTREVRWSIIASFLAAMLALLLLFHFWLNPYFHALARATGYVVNTNLPFAWIILLICVGGVLFGLGRLRPADIGLIRGKIATGAVLFVVLWLVIQVLHLAAAAATGPVEIHPNWEQFGLGPMLAFFVAMAFGIVLMEEVAFRGFVLPQLALKLGTDSRGALWGAVIGSAVIFALLHIPARIVVSGYGAAEVALGMLTLTFAGVYGALFYLRTANLFVVMAVHTLINAPMLIVSSPIEPMVVTIGLGLLLLAIWPLLERKPLRGPLASITAATNGSGQPPGVGL